MRSNRKLLVINVVVLSIAFGCSSSARLDSMLGKLGTEPSFQNTKLTEKVSNLESDLSVLKELLQSQEKVKIDLELSILNLEQKYDDLYKQLSLQSKNVGPDSVTEYKHDTNHQKSRKDRIKRQEDEHVAFSAYVDHEVLSMGKDQTVQFQNVLINDGHGYNSYTGVFTVPRDGVYQLTFFVEDYHRFQSIFHMVVNRNIVTSAIADPLPEGQNVQGGNIIIIRLKAGDSVWVIAAASGDNIEGYGLLRTSTFSGYLLYAWN